MVQLARKLIEIGAAVLLPVFMSVTFRFRKEVRTEPADAQIAYEIVRFGKDANRRVKVVIRSIALGIMNGATTVDLTHVRVIHLRGCWSKQVDDMHRLMADGVSAVFFLDSYNWRGRKRSVLFVTPMARPAFMAAVAKANAEAKTNADRAEKEAAERQVQQAEQEARAKAEAEQRRLDKKAAKKAAEAEAIAAEKAKIAAIPVGLPADFVTDVRYEDDVPASMMAPVQYRATANDGPVEIRTAYPARDAELDADGNIVWSVVYFTSSRDAEQLDGQTMEERRKSLAA